MAEDFKHIRFMVFKASSIKYLFEQLDDEPRPFELVVHPPICKSKIGVRPVTIKASNEEDAKYFKGILNKLSYESLERLTYGTNKVKQ
jgi:hypothetical protein